MSFIKLSSKLGNKLKYNGKKGIMPARILQLDIISNIWCKIIDLYNNFQINHLLPKKLIKK